MTTITIEKNIPMPKARANHKNSFFDEMEVGDSVFLEGRTSYTANPLYFNLRPKKFSSRKTVENGVAGCRVWRTA